MKTYHQVLQYFWLAVAILTGLYAGYVYSVTGGQLDPMLIAMPILAFVLFVMRKWYNGRMQKAEKENNQ